MLTVGRECIGIDYIRNLMAESTISTNIQLLANKWGWRLFRNNVGLAFYFKRGIRYPVRYGLAKGSSDLIGIRSVVITQDMVGQTIGQFVAVEVKSPGKKAAPQQKVFIDVISRMGGYAIVASSPDDLCKK